MPGSGATKPVTSAQPPEVGGSCVKSTASVSFDQPSRRARLRQRSGMTPEYRLAYCTSWDQPQAFPCLRSCSRLCSDLVQIRVLRNLWRNERGRHQVAHGCIRPVGQSVHTVRPDGEVNNLAFGQFSAPFAGPKCRTAAQYHKQLLRPMVEMEWNPITRSEFIETRAQVNATR
jgi:hypothetical protein